MNPTTQIRSLIALASLAITATFACAADSHQHAATDDAKDKYPLTTCVVSGDKLGEMGEPVSYTYKEAGKPDRVIQFCCKDCIKDFEKEPAKYLAKLDAAASGRTAQTSSSTKDASAACCEAGDEACCELLTAYVPIADALAADDLAKARNTAAALAKQADKDGMKAILQPALAIVHANDIASARSAFKTLSKEMTPLAENSKGYVVMNCPMANADWVQTDAKVRNPYYGKMMLTCGAPKASAAK